ncbi:MAG: response regulator [Chloroflexota bacterium]
MRFSNPRQEARRTEKQPIEHILLVEDSPTQALSLKAVLEMEDLIVHVVGDGPEAIEHVQNQPCDLIVLDIELPTLSGYDTCRRLKLNPVTADLPVIMFTSRGRPADTLAGLETGAIDYIPKDVFAEAILMDTIRQLNAGARLHQVNSMAKGDDSL